MEFSIMENQSKNPVRPVWRVGTTAVVTLAPAILKRLNLDENVYLEEQVTEDGNILLKVRRLTP